MLDDSDFGRLDTGGSSTVRVLTATQEVIGVAADTGSPAWMRHSVGLVMAGPSPSVASPPDAAALDIVRDLALRAELQPAISYAPLFVTEFVIPFRSILSPYHY